MGGMTAMHAAPAENPDRIESADGGLWASISRILKLLARPELAKWRPVMAVAVLLTLAAALLEVVSPLVMGHAINQVAATVSGGFAIAALWLTYGLALRFAASRCPSCVTGCSPRSARTPSVSPASMPSATPSACR